MNKLNVSDRIPRSLFYVKNKSAINQHFLIDSGANLSLIPADETDKQNIDNSLLLKGIGGSIVETYGTKRLTIDLGFTKPITWDFTLANITEHVIGMDLLIKQKLAVIPCLRSLLNLSDNKTARLLERINKDNQPQYASLHSEKVNIHPSAVELLNKYPDLTSPSDFSAPIKHNTQHYIQTKGPPISLKARRLSLKTEKPVEEALNNMIAKGIIEPSDSAWGSPIHIVPKKTGSWRLVGDYRHLNRVTKPDKYPLPYLRDFSNDLNNKSIFSALDLKDAYYNIPVHKDDIQKTALSTPRGLYQYKRMPFGLRSASQTFQRFMDGILRNIQTPSGRKPSIFNYLDDILIASENETQHREDVETIMALLSENGLKISPEKCNFFTNRIEFLGHVITPEGLKPQTNKITAIREFPKPKTIKSLRRYMGMINFYHSFVPALAKVLSPVSTLMSCPRGVKDAKIKWTEESSKAFEESKLLLSEKTLLSYMDINLETSVTVDASDTAIAGVLQQRKGETWKPISFFSRKLTTSERKYSTFSKELLSIYSSVKAFRYLIEGIQFYVLTDHKPILKAFPKQSARDLPREERWLEYIAQFTDDIRHVNGVSNVVADCLSRFLDEQEADLPECNIITSSHNDNTHGIDKRPITDILYPRIRQYYPTLAPEIITDLLKLDNSKLNMLLEDNEYFTSRLYKSFENVINKLENSELEKLLPLNSSIQSEPITISNINAIQIDSACNNTEFMEALEHDTELKDILNKKIKFEPKIVIINDIPYVRRSDDKLVHYIPVTMRRRIFDEIHSLGHYGGKASVKLLSSRYVWPKMRRDILKWVSECISCKKGKITTHNKAAVHKFPTSTGKFHEVHIDLVGPLPPNQGFKYLLTMVDRYTRWCEAIPLEDMTTERVMDAFVFHWISRYGVPKCLVTDRGSQFESHLWSSVMKRFGIHRHRTTAYHPASNGLVERFHRTLKESLRSHSDDLGQEWIDKLPHVLLAIRNAINSDTEVSPAQSVFGKELVITSGYSTTLHRRGGTGNQFIH